MASVKSCRVSQPPVLGTAIVPSSGPLTGSSSRTSIGPPSPPAAAVTVIEAIPARIDRLPRDVVDAALGAVVLGRADLLAAAGARDRVDDHAALLGEVLGLEQPGQMRRPSWPPSAGAPGRPPPSV